MRVSQGDRVVIESERVGQPPRTGTVEEVLSLDPLRVRVRWEDDHESAARVEHSAGTGR
jgi:translation initiation factor IF-1